MNSTKREVTQLVATLIEKDPSEIDPDANFVQNLGLNSIKGIELIGKLEDQFNLEVDVENFSEINTINKLCDYVIRHQTQEL